MKNSEERSGDRVTPAFQSFTLERSGWGELGLPYDMDAVHCSRAEVNRRVAGEVPAEHDA
jgi:hypothetical protein